MVRRNKVKFLIVVENLIKTLLNFQEVLLTAPKATKKISKQKIL